MAKVTKETVEKVFDGLLGVIDRDNIDMAKTVLASRKVAIEKIENYEDFHFNFIYPYEQFLKGLVFHLIPKGDASLQFIMLHSSYIENHFQRVIKSIEGSACCADKSRAIVGRICLFFKTGEEIVWDYDAEYTYHMPKKVFTTHEGIMEFYKALENLFYGGVNAYLLAYKKIVENNKTK